MRARSVLGIGIAGCATSVPDIACCASREVGAHVRSVPDIAYCTGTYARSVPGIVYPWRRLIAPYARPVLCIVEQAARRGIARTTWRSRAQGRRLRGGPTRTGTLAQYRTSHSTDTLAQYQVSHSTDTLAHYRIAPIRYCSPGYCNSVSVLCAAAHRKALIR
eukprot:3818327-Rhodomonas_salina.1